MSKAWDEETKTAKAPKTAAGQRTVPIEPALLPLLEAIRRDDNTDESSPVVPPLSAREDRHAGTFRDDLALAKVKRPRLVCE